MRAHAARCRQQQNSWRHAASAPSSPRQQRSIARSNRWLVWRRQQQQLGQAMKGAPGSAPTMPWAPTPPGFHTNQACAPAAAAHGHRLDPAGAP
jgi:hypothetical protein